MKFIHLGILARDFWLEVCDWSLASRYANPRLSGHRERQAEARRPLLGLLPTLHVHRRLLLLAQRLGPLHESVGQVQLASESDGLITTAINAAR